MKKVFLRKIVIVVSIVLFSLLLVTACGTTDSSPINSDEIDSLYTNPDDFKGRTFEFTAQVLDIEKDNNTMYIQAYYDKINYDRNTVIVYESDQNLELNTDDFIKVKGTVEGKFTGENALGTEVTAPQINAESVEKITAVEAFPASKSIDVNQTVSQNGINATITKVDFTDDGELRIYLTLQNTTGSEITAYPDQGYVIQNGTQIGIDTEKEYLYNDENVSLGDIQPSASVEEILPFSGVSQSSFNYSFQGYDSNFNELNFSFDISIQ